MENLSEKLLVYGYNEHLSHTPFLYASFTDKVRGEVAELYPEVIFFVVKRTISETTDIWGDFHQDVMDIDRNEVTWLTEVPPNKRKE